MTTIAAEEIREIANGQYGKWRRKQLVLAEIVRQGADWFWARWVRDEQFYDMAERS